MSSYKLGAIESGAPRDMIEAATLYMADEDNALAFAYSGWAQCALPHRRIPIDQLWEVSSDRMRLVVEPGRRPAGPDGQGAMEFVGVPFGAYARLILLFLQTEALRTGSREVELGPGLFNALVLAGESGMPQGGVDVAAGLTRGIPETANI